MAGCSVHWRDKINAVGGRGIHQYGRGITLLVWEGIILSTVEATQCDWRMVSLLLDGVAISTAERYH